MTPPKFRPFTAAFYGVLLISRKPASAAVLFAVSLVLATLAAWAGFTAYWQLGLGDAGTGLSVGQAVTGLGLGLTALALQLSISAAWLRFLVRGEAGLFPFRLGDDEGRLLLTVLLQSLILLLAILPAILPVAVLALVDSLAADIAFPHAIAIAPVFIALVWAGVRVAAMPALTIRDRRIWGLEAWSVTRGVFWTALLGYLVVLAIGEFIPFSGSGLTGQFRLMSDMDLEAVAMLWRSPDAAGMLSWMAVAVLALAAHILGLGYSAYIARWDALQEREPVADDALLRMRDVAAS